MRIRLDEKWMGMAVGLAKRAGNSTRPNPRVGAVVVKNNKIVGKDFIGRPEVTTRRWRHYAKPECRPKVRISM